MTRNIAVLLLSVGLLFGTSVGMTAYGREGLSPVVRSGPATVSAPANTGTAGLADCTCSCGYICSGLCIGSTPNSCSDSAARVCVQNCCANAPDPDPACGHVGGLDP
jgi:hypothetical protein